MMTLIFRLGRKEIMKCKKILLAIIISASLLSTIRVNTSQPVKASKSSDIYSYGFDSNHPEKYFYTWRKVVLLHNTDFDQSGKVLRHYWESPLENATLKKGTFIKIKYSPTNKSIDYSPISYWTVYCDKLPKTGKNSEIWYFSNMKSKFYHGQLMDALEHEVATPSSYFGLSTIFDHKNGRKVKVIRPVKAYKIKQEIPAYKNHIVGKTTIKKGTVLKVTGPSNHWTLKVSGKGVREHYPYIWDVSKRSGWYKLIN